MSDNVLIAILAAIPSTLAAIGALVVSVLNRGQIQEVRHATNSLLDARVQTEGELRGSEGQERGRLLGKNEAAEDRAKESRPVEVQVVKTQTVEVQKVNEPDKTNNPPIV